MKLKVTRKSHGRREDGKLVVYQTGDVLEGTERELRAFSDRLSAVSDSDEPPSRDQLAMQAMSLGVKVRKDWGEARIQQEIDNVQE